MLIGMPDDSSARPRIILDCDPGHDDVIAIVVAAHCTDLVGITTVAGNAPLDRTTYNACVMRDALGLDTTVHSGAERPLLAEPKFAGFVHGESGLDGADLPVADAWGRRCGRGRVHHRDVPIAARASGWCRPARSPTSRLALRSAPDLVDHIAGISLMGGGTFGNRAPLAEFNIWADPDAAAIVFGSGVDLTMAGLDVTHQFLVTPNRIEQVALDRTLRSPT